VAAVRECTLQQGHLAETVAQAALQRLFAGCKFHQQIGVRFSAPRSRRGPALHQRVLPSYLISTFTGP
jgi:hypothetical protein